MRIAVIIVQAAAKRVPAGRWRVSGAVKSAEFSKKVIGVVSGKGGVGKSLVTSLMACKMRARNNRVGILDADITGPSIEGIWHSRHGRCDSGSADAAAHDLDGDRDSFFEPDSGA